MLRKKYLSQKYLFKVKHINEDTLRKWIKEGKFPRPLRTNNRTTLWSYALIENWIAQKHKTEELINNHDLDL